MIEKLLTEQVESTETLSTMTQSWESLHKWPEAVKERPGEVWHSQNSGGI